MKLTLGVRTTGTSSGTAAWEIRTGATPGRFRLIELGFFLVSATATAIGFGRPQAVGITPTSPVDFQHEDPNDILASGLLQSALAWGTGPTIPLNFLSRIQLPATIGAGVIWNYGPSGIVIPASGSLILWNLAANSTLDAYAKIEL